jgi:hypothetical protein
MKLLPILKTKTSQKGRKPYHKKDTLKNQNSHTNQKREMASISTHNTPNPVHTRSLSNGTTEPPALPKHAPPSRTFQIRQKQNGDEALKEKTPLQARNPNYPPMKHSDSCPPRHSLMESNHRHLMAEFADWFKFARQKAPLPQTFQHTYTYYDTPITSQDLRMPPPNEITSTSYSPRFHTPQFQDTRHHHQQQNPRPNRRNKTRATAMHIDNLAGACYLGPEILIRSRNPHTRGTPKHTKRQNINRNIRLHLRNDRKHVQEDFNTIQQLYDTHFVFYCTLVRL